MSHLARSRVLPAVVACLAMAGLAQPASAETGVYRSARVSLAPGAAIPQETGGAKTDKDSLLAPGLAGSRSLSGTKATVACKRLHSNHIRCTMTIKRGAGISGTVSMRITRGKLLVAFGRGDITGGKATLTMRLLHRMTPGRYTVAMLVTLHATMVLRLR